MAERPGYGTLLVATPWAARVSSNPRQDGVPLADCAIGSTVTILRLENEAEDLLHYLKESGIEPGLTGEVIAKDDAEVTVSGPSGPATVTVSVAETVSVKADPSPPSMGGCSGSDTLRSY